MSLFGAGLPTPPKRPTEGLLFSASKNEWSPTDLSEFPERPNEYQGSQLDPQSLAVQSVGELIC